MVILIKSLKRISQFKISAMNLSVSSVSIWTQKVKQNCLRSVLGRIMPLEDLWRGQCYDGMKSMFNCTTVKRRISWTNRQATKVEEASPSWRIKIKMACLRITFVIESQIVSNIPLSNFDSTKNPLNFKLQNSMMKDLWLDFKSLF